MSLTVNGHPEPLPQPATLDALLTRLSPQSPFAVACNGDFVPRDAYAECALNPGDEIEIVRPSAGG
jgi:sulfur carrier protein